MHSHLNGGIALNEFSEVDFSQSLIQELTWILKRVIVFTLLLIGLTILLRTFPLDIQLAGLFYSSTSPHWPYCDYWVWESIDHLAVYLVWGLLMLQVGLVYKFRRSTNQEWYLKFLITHVLVLAIGPGLMINQFMKHTFCRPRPREIQEFAGKYPYSPPLSQGISCSNNPSFPSGHASIGFMLLLPWMSLTRKSWYSPILLLIGIAWGTLVGFSRIIQGGHFLSDIIYSAFIVIGLTWTIDMLMQRIISKRAGSVSDG